jgi:hypothetical protein
MMEIRRLLQTVLSLKKCMCTSVHLIKGTPCGPDDIKLLCPCMGQYVFHHTLPRRVAVPSTEFLKTESFKHPHRKKSKGMIPWE